MEEKRNVLMSFTEEVKKIFGSSLCQVILYGSYARGDFQKSSDVDIMILTSMSDAEIRKIENKVYDIAYDYTFSDDITISVNIKNEEHFNYWLGALPYYDNIRREGVVLAG